MLRSRYRQKTNVISFYLEGKEVLNRKYFDNNIYGFIDIKNVIDRFVDKI